MLTEINRMGFASVQADSEFRQREDELKEEQARLAREIGHLEDTKSSLEADLSAKQQTLASYSAITREILEEWKNHRDETCSCIADATGTVPACEHHVFIADISGHRVMFLAFALSAMLHGNLPRPLVPADAVRRRLWLCRMSVCCI